MPLSRTFLVRRSADCCAEFVQAPGLTGPGDDIVLDREFSLLQAHYTIRGSAGIEEHKHPFSILEYRIIRRVHAYAIDATASDPERHYLPWGPGQHALHCQRDIRMNGRIMGIPGTYLLDHRAYDNRIRLPGEVFY